MNNENGEKRFTHATRNELLAMNIGVDKVHCSHTSRQYMLRVLIVQIATDIKGRLMYSYQALTSDWLVRVRSGLRVLTSATKYLFGIVASNSLLSSTADISRSISRPGKTERTLLQFDSFFYHSDSALRSAISLSHRVKLGSFIHSPRTRHQAKSQKLASLLILPETTLSIDQVLRADDYATFPGFARSIRASPR